jgi:hypothetical protein
VLRDLDEPKFPVKADGANRPRAYEAAMRFAAVVLRTFDMIFSFACAGLS